MKYFMYVLPIKIVVIILLVIGLMITILPDGNAVKHTIPEHIVLVHGSFHGAWCWYKVIPALQTMGHDVTAVELPGYGANTPPATISLDDYVNAVVAAIDSIDRKIILIGHSMGGIVISSAAELRSYKISKLIYLAAFMIPSGTSMFDYAQLDENSVAGQNLVIDPAGDTFFVAENALVSAFYAESPVEDQELALSLVKPDPLSPIVTPLDLTDENFGSIRRFYIVAENDNAITPWLQYLMIDNMPCEKIRKLRTDHSPFFSDPDELVKQIGKILKK